MKKHAILSTLVLAALLVGAAIAGIKPEKNATLQTVESDTTLDIEGTLQILGTSVTSTAAELNKLHGAPVTASFSPAAGSTNVSLVTVTIKDGTGAAVAKPTNIDVWLSDAATGAGLTATTASGAVAAGASGADLGTLTTKKALRSQTTATGVYILSVTDSAKTGFYPCISVSGLTTCGAQLVSGNYG